VEVLRAFNVDKLEFGRDYILPKALDARLLGAIAGAVAKAAIDTGVAKLHYPAHYPL
jgi:malate dehydrogenase (oxaloacetate-decarboxylating)(NADP+)